MTDDAKAMTSERRVVCAAIRAADGSLLLGIRHYSRDMREQMEARTDGAKFAHRNGDDQGFVDQHGVYLTREEAFNVASLASQITDRHACIHSITHDGSVMKLTSEGLY